jgi:hypothetical protein
METDAKKTIGTAVTIIASIIGLVSFTYGITMDTMKNNLEVKVTQLEEKEMKREDQEKQLFFSIGEIRAKIDLIGARQEKILDMLTRHMEQR